MHYYGVKFVYSSLRYCTLPLAVVLMKTVLCCCSIDLSAVVSMPSKYRICRVVYYSLPIRANCSRQHHGLCLVVLDETKNETCDILQMNQSETVNQASHPRVTAELSVGQRLFL